MIKWLLYFYVTNENLPKVIHKARTYICDNCGHETVFTSYRIVI